MAAMRLALMRLRCGNFGSSAAASMGARGLEIRQVVGPATPRLPLLPSLRPAAARNLEGSRHFSTEGMEKVGQNKPLLMKHKAERILRMWWQRSRETLKNDIRRRNSIIVYTGCAAVICYWVWIARAVHLSAFGSRTDSRTSPHAPMPRFGSVGTVYTYPFINSFRCSYTPSVIPSFYFLNNEHTRGKPVRYTGGGAKSTKMNDRS